MCGLSFPYIYLPTSCLVAHRICTAQLSSGCPDLMRMDQAVGRAEGSTPHRLPTPGCREPRLHSWGWDSNYQRNAKDMLCFGLEDGGFHVQLKQKKKRYWESPIPNYIPLNYILSNNKKKLTETEKRTKRKYLAATLLMCLLYSDCCDALWKHRAMAIRGESAR